eukprot:COSAG02_NODE_578_length_20075_cov_93.607930_8_plen_162_part_00
MCPNSMCPLSGRRAPHIMTVGSCVHASWLVIASSLVIVRATRLRAVHRDGPKQQYARQYDLLHSRPWVRAYHIRHAPRTILAHPRGVPIFELRLDTIHPTIFEKPTQCINYRVMRHGALPCPLRVIGFIIVTIKQNIYANACDCRSMCPYTRASDTRVSGD